MEIFLYMQEGLVCTRNETFTLTTERKLGEMLQAQKAACGMRDGSYVSVNFRLLQLFSICIVQPCPHFNQPLSHFIGYRKPAKQSQKSICHGQD